MRCEVWPLLAAQYFVQAFPLPYPRILPISPRWVQHSAPLSPVNRAPQREEGGGHRNTASPSSGDVIFIDPNGRPLATFAKSELNPLPAAITPSSSVPLNISATKNPDSTVPALSGMVGIVPAVGNNPGLSPPLTSFDSVPVPSLSGASPAQNSTSIAQALQPSQPTALASSGMVGIVPAVPNNPDSSPPLTAFPSIPAANPNSLPTPAASNGTRPRPMASASSIVVYTTRMITVIVTRTQLSSSATPIANSSTSLSTTPAPFPAVLTASGISGDTFPLISSNAPATAASIVLTLSTNGTQDSFDLRSTALSSPAPALSTPTNPGTLFSFSPSGLSSNSPMLVIPCLQTVSRTDQSTLTIDPPNASTVAPPPLTGANPPQSGSAAVETPAPVGAGGLSIVPLPIPGAPVIITITVTATLNSTSVSALTSATASSTTTSSTPSLVLVMGGTASPSATLTIPLPG